MTIARALLAFALAAPLAACAAAPPPAAPAPAAPAAPAPAPAAPAAPDPSTFLPGAEARALVARGAKLVDVRTPEEFAAGHIDGAVNVPVDRVEATPDVGPRDVPVVVYCHRGRRAARAAAVLRASGYVEVHNLGPMEAWAR